MIVNGETLLISNLKVNSVQGLLEYYNLNKNRIAMEINGQVIKKADYDSVKFNETDKVEIIHFVGGGNESFY